MSKPRHRRLGYTLAELLISLAIIAMLTGAAIPAVTKIAGFMSKKSDSAARELFGVLAAARTSAVSYRNDIAVVYAVHQKKDDFNGAQSYIIDGFGMARRVSKEQIGVLLNEARYADFAAALDSSNSGVQEDDIFVLAQEPQARFRKMPNQTAVIGHLTNQEEQTLRASGFLDEPPQSIEDFYDGDDVNDPAGMYEGLQSRGMRVIYLFKENDADELEPVPADEVLNSNFVQLPAAIRAYAFPAHVFLPTGELSAPGSSLDSALKERITIAVGPSPDAPIEDRFTIAPNNENGDIPMMVSPVRIELYRSTGRVQIAS